MSVYSFENSVGQKPANWLNFWMILNILNQSALRYLLKR